MKFAGFGDVALGEIKDKSEDFVPTLENYPDYYYESKKTYEHGPDEHNGTTFLFNYKYIIQIQGWADSSLNIDPEKEFSAALYLVVSPENICPEKLKSILSTFGYEDHPDYLHYDDIVSYGAGIMMVHTSGILREEKWEGFSEEKIPEMVNLMANYIEFVDGMRGFFLDKQFNDLGWTGWTVIYDLLCIEKPSY